MRREGEPGPPEAAARVQGVALVGESARAHWLSGFDFSWRWWLAWIMGNQTKSNLDPVIVAVVAFWMTETAGGGFAMGEAPDEAEARLEIARAQGRASVNYHERSMRYRWTVVVDDDKTHHGWVDSEAEAWWYVKEALNRPHRGTRYVRPRGLFGLPPA